MTDIELQQTIASASGPAQLDAVLSAALDLARAAAVEVGAEHVGEHVDVQAEGERLATHRFASTLPGYVGWYWAVSLVRAPRAKVATVADVVLLPGVGALLAPEWVPWNERLQPGDLSPGDLLPPDPADPRLIPAYTLSDDPAVEAVAFELGMGRERVMSREGRLDAADRWYAGDAGPDAPMARQAPASCGTCGFLLPLAGSLQAGFGVCGNEISSTDGRVVSVEYGCGAHSQAKVVIPALSEAMGEVYDDGDELTLNPMPVASASAASPEPEMQEPELQADEPV
ncbi:MAG: DUF3027 domain-containing protein [Jatrophihabitantaceae bacterium]